MEPIEDATQKRDKSENRVLVEKLVDKENPEMITFVLASEVDDIAVMQAVSSTLNTEREKLGLDKSFLDIFIKNNLIIRTSMKGKRSEQIVNTIHQVVNEEVGMVNPLQNLGKRLLGR